MKKIFDLWGHSSPTLKKLIMTLKIAFFIIVAGVSNVLATPGYSQVAKVSLDMENKSLEQVMDEIELQSEFYFIFNQKQVDVNRTVDIQAENKLIIDILPELFNGTNVNYVVFDRKILLTTDPLENSLLAIASGTELQQKQITGIVTDETGSPMPGVNIQIEGTTTGAISDASGKYSIVIQNDNAVLVFSFIGYNTQKVSATGKTNIDVSLPPSVSVLDEVVVTALGIKREVKSIGYSVTSVGTKQFTDARVTNMGNSLIGKVAGMNVTAPPTGPGGSSKIRIRGQSSFGGNNTPLIVINGVPINNTVRIGSEYSDLGDGLQSINPDDIESMTVLKGASAAALYGFRAKDGVIIITTRSGLNQKGIGVELNSSFQADKAIDYTDFQYEYGQGENGIRNLSVADARKTGVWSYGPKFDGQPTWQVDGTEKPYLPFKDRINSFYVTGITATNSLALSGGNDNGNFRLSFSNTGATGIVPNSKFNKKNIDLGLNYNLSKKFSVKVNANYSVEDSKNPPAVATQNFNVNSTLITLANSIDPRWLKTAYKDPVTGNEISIARFLNRTNMYWTVNEHEQNQIRNRLYGNVTLRYQLAPWLYAQGRAAEDYYNIMYDGNTPTGTGFLSTPTLGFNGSFSQSSENFKEINLDFLVGVNKKFGDFGIDATVGGNSMDQIDQTLSASVSNFYVRDLYTIGNGQIKSPSYSYSRKKVNSLYGTVNFSFKDYLFLNATGRNDWFSTLNPKSNSYLYPSVSASFVFSQAFSELMPAWLNYGKIRAAYAEVGGDTDPYTNLLYYSMDSNTLNGVALGNISGTVSPNANLKPLKVKEAEVGLELNFFDSRINLDFAAYRKNTVDEILNIDISNASGFGQTKVNVGRLRNQGIEALLTVVAVRTQNFSWESAINYAYNKSLVLELATGQKKIDVGTGGLCGTASEELGMPMSSIRGLDYKRDAQGRIITTNGRFAAGDYKTFGSAIPKHTGGWLNTITYKGFRVFTQIDFKAGNKLISGTNFNLTRHGLHKNTLVGREGGVVFDGVNADGTPNTTAVEAEAFYMGYGVQVLTPFVYDASFIRWRTLSVGADLSRFVNKTFIKGLNINAFINNVLVIKKYVDNLDPECIPSVSDLTAGLESPSLPTTRSYGLNLNVKF